MNARNMVSRIYNKLSSLEKKEGDVLSSANKEVQAAKLLWVSGMLILIVTTGGLLPEKLDAILHNEIFSLGVLVCILGLFLFNRVIGYVILTFLVLALAIIIIAFYSTYYGVRSY